jgi:hypothetical protein
MIHFEFPQTTTMSGAILFIKYIETITVGNISKNTVDNCRATPKVSEKDSQKIVSKSLKLRCLIIYPPNTILVL